MTLTPLPPVTVGQVLHNTLPAMQHLSDIRSGLPLRWIAYALAYDRRLWREVDANRTTLNRPASPCLIALSSRLIDVSVSIKMGT